MGDSTDPDALARRAAAGDREAFEQLYRWTVPVTFGLCLRLTADREAAHELTQAAYVRVWEQIGSFRGDSAFLTWFHRLTVNVCLREVERRRRRAIHTEDVDPDTVAQADCGQAIGKRVDLVRALGRLPHTERMVLVLHDVEGYRHKEIGEMMGIPEGTSRRHLHEARRQMRGLLK